jgi:two-component system nitrogen regulation response regulator NtrX
MPNVLIVDSSPNESSLLGEYIKAFNPEQQVTTCVSTEKAIELVQANTVDLIICDAQLNGLELMIDSRVRSKSIPVVITSSRPSFEEAVSFTKQGATDYLQKPLNIDRLMKTIAQASEYSQQQRELMREAQKKYEPYEMVGSSPSLAEVKEMIEKLAPGDARVLILGPNGAGKELVARSLHSTGKRASNRFVEVNCAAIPSELIESELFGHEKGAFTSAIGTKIGKFEQANGGTLFLDEIGDMSLSAQTKMLRALQEKKVTRVGGNNDIPVDVRVIAATNKDLKKEIERGTFREDLYHRLSVVVINVPSLNERRADIPELTTKFIFEVSKQHGIKPKSIEGPAMEILMSRNWTGNIRELRNVTERLMILSDGERITASDVKRYAIESTKTYGILGVSDKQPAAIKVESYDMSR